MNHPPLLRWHERALAILEERGWSRAELARRADIGRENIYKYLAGGVEKPRGKTLQAIAGALGVSEMWLTFGTGESGFSDEEGRAKISPPLGRFPRFPRFPRFFSRLTRCTRPMLWPKRPGFRARRLWNLPAAGWWVKSSSGFPPVQRLFYVGRETTEGMVLLLPAFCRKKAGRCALRFWGR